MLKYTIEFNDHGMSVIARPEINPVALHDEQRAVREAYKEPETAVQVLDGHDAEDVPFAQDVDNNNDLVSELDLRQRVICFEGQIERAKELLGKRGLNANAMRYILTGEKPTRGRKKR